MHFLSFAATALAVTAIAAPARAQASPAYYVATPAVPQAKIGFVTRTAAWRLQNGAFVADQVPERPEILCQLGRGPHRRTRCLFCARQGFRRQPARQV